MKAIILIGCFGNHPFDRHMERELERYLEGTEEIQCPECGYVCEKWEVEENDGRCPECETILIPDNPRHEHCPDDY